MTLVSEAILKDAQKALSIEQKSQDSTKNSPIGSLQGRAVTIVVMVASCALAATAAVIMAIFAFYIAAAILAAACLIQIVATIVASRMNVSQKLLTTMKQLTESKIKLDKENDTLKKQGLLSQKRLEEKEKETAQLKIERLANPDQNPEEIEKLKIDLLNTQQQILELRQLNKDLRNQLRIDQEKNIALEKWKNEHEAVGHEKQLQAKIANLTDENKKIKRSFMTLSMRLNTKEIQDELERMKISPNQGEDIFGDPADTLEKDT